MQQALWLKGRNSMCIFADAAGEGGGGGLPTQEEKNYMCIGGKNLSDYSLKGRESRPIGITQ